MLGRQRDFCSKHEEIIGNVHDDILGDFPVYADIHRAEKTEDAIVKVLMKKMKIGLFDSEYQAKGYAGCDVIDYKPDREGISIDEYNSKYSQFKSILLKYYESRGIEKKPTEAMKNLRNEKKWKEKAKEVFLRYYSKNPLHRLLNVDSIVSPSSVTGKQVRKKVTRARKKCENGFHWDDKLMKCVPNLEKVEHKPTDIKVPYKPRKHRGRKGKLTNEFSETEIPDFKMRKGSDSTKFGVYLNEAESAFIFNTVYDWAIEAFDHPNDSTMDLLLTIALMNAVKDNQGITGEEFLKRLAKQL